MSVQALVGGSSSAREDSETDCEVRKFAIKKNNGSKRLTLRIKKGSRSSLSSYYGGLKAALKDPLKNTLY